MSKLAADFFRQNTWANIRLIEFCEGIGDQVLDATAPGTYGTLRQVLVHMIGSLGRYLDRLGLPASATANMAGEWPGFPVLKEVASADGNALIKAAEEAPDDWEVTCHFVGLPHERNGEWKMPGSLLLAQALNHCTDHRSQICTILTQAGIEPPELDGWAWGDASGQLRPAK